MTLSVAILTGLTVLRCSQITLLIECRFHDAVTAVSGTALTTIGAGGTGTAVLRTLVTLFACIQSAVAAGGNGNELTGDGAITADLTVPHAVVTLLLRLSCCITAVIVIHSKRRWNIRCGRDVRIVGSDWNWSIGSA